MSDMQITKPKKATPIYTQAQLLAAFTKVENAVHWKHAIDAVIDESEQDITNAAIVHFAYGNASFVPADPGKLRVRAPGYYAMEDFLGS